MIKKYTLNDLDILVEILKNDGTICVPTDTVYGICAKVGSKVAFEKLLEVKNRPENKQFPVMCADKEQIKEIAEINETAEKIIKAFMPGPITIVLKKKQNLPEYITNGKNTIAVRMATSKVLEQLIKKVGVPLFMTSANQSGTPTCNTVEEVEKTCPKLDAILEGKIVYGKSSTIIDCSTEEVKLLRSGPISLEDILKLQDN